MSHKCPSCGSTQTASIKVAQARETTTGKFGGLGINTDGDLGVIGGTTSNVSAFGRTLAAPTLNADRRSQFIPLGLVLAGFLVGGWCLLMLGGAKPSQRPPYIWFAVIAGMWTVSGLVWYAINSLHNGKNDDIAAAYTAKAREQWARLWVCYQCGEKFEPAK